MASPPSPSSPRYRLSRRRKDPAKLRVALLPDENAATLIQNAQPLKAYLEKTLSKEIELVVTTDYSSMIEAMRFGRIEIAYFGPFSYVLAKSKAPDIEAFAVGVEKGKPTYNSILIAQADGPVKRSRRHPRQAVRLRRPGLDVKPPDTARPSCKRKVSLGGRRLSSVVHLGTHDGIARAVQNGQVPAGALSKPIYRDADRPQHRSIPRQDHARSTSSDPIPNYPIIMQGNLVPALKDNIRKAFLEAEGAGRC